MTFERDKFHTNMDWITYKVTGKIPKYLKDEPLRFYLTNGKIPNRGSVHIVGEKKTLCSCYDYEFPEILENFKKQYNGTNIKKLQKQYRKRYNIRSGKVPITRLRDCNISFTSKRNDGRLDAVTAMKKKRYSLCRCYPEEKDEVSADFDRMKKDPEYDVSMIQNELRRKYNLKNRKTVSDEIRLSSNGDIFFNGKLVKKDKEIYDVIRTVL